MSPVLLNSIIARYLNVDIGFCNVLSRSLDLCIEGDPKITWSLEFLEGGHPYDLSQVRFVSLVDPLSHLRLRVDLRDVQAWLCFDGLRDQHLPQFVATRAVGVAKHLFKPMSDEGHGKAMFSANTIIEAFIQRMITQ